MLEARKQKRIETSPVIRYWTAGNPMIISQAYNFSEKGIFFNMGKEYPKDTPIYIQMRSPKKLNETITFKAKVLRQEKKPEESLYKTAAEIVAFYDEDDSQRLQGYIDFALDCTQ
jgi:hypothetical protein